MGVIGLDRDIDSDLHTEEASVLVNSWGKIISANLYQKAKVAMNNLFTSFTFAPAMA